MQRSIPRRRVGSLGVASTILGGVLAIGLALPALAANTPTDPEDPVIPGGGGTTSFTPDLQADIFIGEETLPNGFVASADGKFGYVTQRWLNEVAVVDLTTRQVVNRIPTAQTGGDDITLSADGTRAYFTLLKGEWSAGVGVIDLTAGTFLREFAAVPESITEIAVAADGKSIYVLGLHGDLIRLDAETGAELAQASFTTVGAYGLALIKGDSELLVSMDDKILTLNADDLTEKTSATLPELSSTAFLRIDTSDERVYFADSSGSTLGVFNPTTGTIAGRAAVGSQMGGAVGYDDLDRAFGPVPYWTKIMAADLTAGVRSESFRSTPTAPFSIAKNPVTGDILTANAGWTNSTKGSTVSVIYAPSASDPADAVINAPDATARFETEALGIKQGHGGGVVWQSSIDGEAWTDIEGATDEQLDVVATDEARQLQYRVRWHDDFWGISGATGPAQIVTQGPVITFAGPLTDGEVGAAYPNTVITATGLPDLAWELALRDGETGLPAGLTLDPKTGALSGTPSVAGTFTFTVRVTDEFGEDSKSFTLTVAEKSTPPGPTEPGKPTPGDPASPQDPLSDTGATSPLLIGLVAAGVIAAGATALWIGRRRAAQEA